MNSKTVHDLLYVARVMAAVTLALGAAYVMQLDSPAAAASTVLIVASPVRGAILSKSVWRVLGSIAGGIAAVVLMALFAQSPLLFIAGLAVWLGVCTAISSLLRYFRSYGAVLAGYTVCLVAFGALKSPEHIFELALSRIAVVTTGVISSALVFMITAPSPGRPQLRKQLAASTEQSLALLKDALSGKSERALLVQRHAVGGGIAALDQAVEFAAVEDAAVSRFAGTLRLAAANLFSAILGGLYAMERLRVDAPRLANGLATLLSEISTDAPVASSNRLAAALTDLDEIDADLDIAALSAADQANGLIGQLRIVMDALAALDSGVLGAEAPRLPVYVNGSTALRNGMRAALAMLLGGWFWIESSWTEGGIMLAMLGPMSSLLAQADSASAASVGFLIGSIFMGVGAFICTFAVLPHMTDFPMLIVGLTPFLAVGIWASLKPKIAPIAVPYLIFFLSLVGAGNPMQFNMGAFINSALGFIVGGACGVFTFRILLPPNPIAEAAFLSRSIQRALRGLARKPGRYSLGWEHLQHQKLIRLSRRLSPFPDRRIAAVQEAEKAVLIGRRLGQIGQALDDPNLPEDIALPLRSLGPDLQRMAITPLQASHATAPMVISPDLGARRLAACVYDLATLLQRPGPFPERLAETHA